MGWLTEAGWRTGAWITPAIHGYAVVVFVLTLLLYLLHRARLAERARRVAAIAAQIEGKAVGKESIRFDQTVGLLLHLGDVVERRTDLDIAPVLEFVRREERSYKVGVLTTLVHLTETMIELFPMLGIFGTVWAISAVSQQDFGSQRLLFLFGVATSTTLYALLYVIVFRIAYSAFVQGKVSALAEQNERFQQFLNLLEKRFHSADFGIEGATDLWGGKR